MPTAMSTGMVKIDDHVQPHEWDQLLRTVGIANGTQESRQGGCGGYQSEQARGREISVVNPDQKHEVSEE